MRPKTENEAEKLKTTANQEKAEQLRSAHVHQVEGVTDSSDGDTPHR